jgi:hypothetical protein
MHSAGNGEGTSAAENVAAALHSVHSDGWYNRPSGSEIGPPVLLNRLERVHNAVRALHEYADTLLPSGATTASRPASP